MAGLDFTAIIKGQRAAQADERQRRADQRSEVDFQFQQDQRRTALEQQSWDQEAAAYTSSLLTNMQRAADAGQNDLDFLIAQREAVLGDPTFNSFTPEVQQRVLKQLGEAAQVTSQQYVQAGDPAAARRLYGAFGWAGQIPQREVAFTSGDVGQIISSIDPGKTLLRDNGDGTHTYVPTGQIMRADRLAAVVQAGGGAQALPLLSATLYQEEQQAKQQAQWQLQLQEQTLQGQGFLKQLDGTWLHPTTGVKLPAIQLPGATPAAAGAAPGAPAPPQVLPVGTAPVAVPDATPVSPIPGAITSLQQHYATLPQQQQQVAAVEQEVARISAQLDQLAPRAVREDRLNRRFLAQSANGPAITKLEQDLLAANQRLDQARIAAKMTEQQVLPGLEAQLGTDITTAGPAAWNDQLVEQIATAGATLPAATTLARRSPTLVSSYLQAMESRIAELYGVAGQEAQVVRLINARDNFNAALSASRRR